jgi:AcrR family transcriptional regulator
MARSQSGTRDRILRAAEDVVIRDGVSKLTLEAAALEAGVSKGGVLYHFPSRGALVSAMVDRFVVSFDDDLAAFGGLGGKPGDFTRAYLRATLEPSSSAGAGAPEEEMTELELRDRRLGGALLAGMASDPELLAPLRDRFAAWQAALEADGLPPAVATLVRLCADGLWLADLLELAPVRGELRADVGRELAALIEASAPALAAARPSRGAREAQP